mmetsp:Transcript_2176/g.5138  ORF Transcript_2176/g.5138 Transcript_2176/m.5138 type:complete len:372 (-) Transcript_2176:47-1162(-)
MQLAVLTAHGHHRVRVGASVAEGALAVVVVDAGKRLASANIPQAHHVVAPAHQQTLSAARSRGAAQRLCDALSVLAEEGAHRLVVTGAHIERVALAVHVAGTDIHQARLLEVGAHASASSQHGCVQAGQHATVGGQVEEIDTALGHCHRAQLQVGRARARHQRNAIELVRRETTDARPAVQLRLGGAVPQLNHARRPTAHYHVLVIGAHAIAVLNATTAQIAHTLTELGVPQLQCSDTLTGNQLNVVYPFLFGSPHCHRTSVTTLHPFFTFVGPRKRSHVTPEHRRTATSPSPSHRSGTCGDACRRRLVIGNLFDCTAGLQLGYTVLEKIFERDFAQGSQRIEAIFGQLVRVCGQTDSLEGSRKFRIGRRH